MQVELEQLQKYLREFVDHHGSQNRAAKMLGVSSALVSQILAGKTDQIAEKTLSAIARAVMPSEWQLVETANLKTAHRLCQDAQLNGTLRYLSADSGFGKTTALKAYCRTRPNAYYVLAVECMSEKEFLQEILRAMGVEADGTKWALLQRIRTRLLQDENPLLVIDDAGKMSEKKLHKVQNIYDLTEGQAGLVLSSVPYGYDNLIKAARKQRPGAPELQRRVGYNQKLKQPTKKEKLAVAQLNGLTRQDVADWVAGQASNYGSLTELIRSALNLLHEQPELPLDDLRATLDPAA